MSNLQHHPRRKGTFLLLAGALVLLPAVALTGVSAKPQATGAKAQAADARPQAAAPAKLEYNRDIRPILAENCFACHGPDSASRKAALRLDQRTVAVKRHAITPGSPDKSRLVDRIFATDAKEIMPPVKTTKKLTPEQKDTLRRWIAEGAEYQPHWSLIAPKRPALPVVKNAKWVRNPVDNFVLAELEKLGLQPAPEADRWTLGRRLSLDLTGLPPEPKELEAFVNDPRPDAYERFVDKLLESPHYGEHRAHYWLDAARYADTHGIHFDNYREMWAYRDWVISAFNKNMPFDRFTIEQLAGDLLPNRTLDQQVATGFNRCNITSNEGGLIPEEYLVLYTRDRTETVSFVFMGLTANCSVCHDHKFDPLAQKEFYQMAAFFNNTTQGAMDGNIKDTPPVVFMPTLEDRPRWDVLSKELAELRQQSEKRKQAARAEFEKWLSAAKSEQVAGMVPSQALHLHAGLSEGEGKTLHLSVNGQKRDVTLPGGLVWDKGHIAAKALKTAPGETVEIADAGDFDKNQAFSYGAWVRLPRRIAGGAIAARMDDKNDFRGWDLWIENNQVGTHIINKWPVNAVKVTSQAQLKAGQWNHVLVTYDGLGKAAGVGIYINGVPQGPKTVFADTLKDTIRTQVPLKLGQRHTTSRIDGLEIQDLRIYSKALTGLEAEQLVKGTRAAWLATKPAAQRTPAEKDELFGWWLPSMDMGYQQLNKKLKDVQQEETAIKSRGTLAHVSQERNEKPHAYVLFRGDYDKRRDKVEPATPEALPPMPSDLPKNRLGFAKWLLRPEHPLTTRVTVNRYWQEIFGTGLVRTASDFGVAGELPSHPELLDWLAVEFRENGWDIKKFFKMLVTSSAYRQAALVTKDRLEKDPDNRFLSRGPHYRLDAEMIRDYALAASGLLVRKVGGPSVKPYQPEGVWEAVGMIGSNTRDYRRDTGAKLYRRSLYTFWKRAAPPASMDILNAPSRETCTVRRERTNTPLQALVTLNDPQFVEAARHLAQLTLKTGGSQTETRIDFMARRLLCRPLRPEETKVVRDNLSELLAFYQAHPEDARKLLTVGEDPVDPALAPPELAAWTMVANELLNLDEVLNK
jgi:mono/diheme cytochrome c family protein